VYIRKLFVGQATCLPQKIFIRKQVAYVTSGYSQAGSLRYNVAIRKLVACATSGNSQAV